MNKKHIFSPITVIAVILIATFFNSCTDKDTTAPRVFLLGPNPYYITLNDKYIEYGFEVNDNRDDSASLDINIDNDIEILEEDYLNTEDEDIFLGVGATVETGDYIITYTIKDKAGNKTVVERNVIIRNSLDIYSRAYTVEKDNISNPSILYEDYEIELEAHENLNNRIWFPRFSNLPDYNLSVYADIVGDSIYIPFHAFTEHNNSLVEGDDDTNNGYAGKFTRSNYKFEITYTYSNNATGARVFHEILRKL